MTLRVYVDYMSQPCRALVCDVLFLKLNNISYEEHLIRIMRGEHMTDAFAKVNPFLKVPAIEHNGFTLSETPAILRYIAANFPVADHWYPADSQRRAKVDEYMSWQHTNLRMYGSFTFLRRTMARKKDANPSYEAGLEKALNELVDIFLAGSPYVNGQAEITIADLMCVSELEQPLAAGSAVLTGNQPVLDYMQRVVQRVGPQLYNETAKAIHLVRDRVAQGKL